MTPNPSKMQELSHQWCCRISEAYGDMKGYRGGFKLRGIFGNLRIKINIKGLVLGIGG